MLLSYQQWLTVLVLIPGHFTCVQLFATLWTVGSPPGSYFHGILQVKILEWVVAISYSGDLPDSEIEPPSLTSPALASGFFTASTTWEAIDALLLLKETRIRYSPSCFPPVTIISLSTSKLLSKMHVNVFVEFLNDSDEFQQNAELLHHF